MPGRWADRAWCRYKTPAHSRPSLVDGRALAAEEVGNLSGRFAPAAVGVMGLAGRGRTGMSDSVEQKTVKMPCIECGGWPKKHHVVREFTRIWKDDDGDTSAVVDYQICQCLGCDHVGFREICTTAD